MDLNDILNEGEGYNINTSDLVEWLIINMISNNFLTSEILRRQIELEQKISTGTVDSDAATEELMNIANQIAEKATNQKNELIGKLFLRNKD